MSFHLKICGSRGRALLEKAIHSNVSPHLNLCVENPSLFYFNARSVFGPTCHLKVNLSQSSIYKVLGFGKYKTMM